MSTEALTPLSYSVQGAIALTGMSYSALDRAIQSGDLRCRRLARTRDGEPTGKRLILHADLMAYLENLPEG